MRVPYPRSLYPRFLRSIEAVCGKAPLRSVLVGFSGGPDSSALLHLFVRLRQQREPELRVIAAHVHHGARGADADADAEHCRTIATEIEVEYVERRVDVPTLAAERSISFETAAREVRRESFASWAQELEVGFVATGHHRDDQVETVLGRLIRGSGVRGLAGIAPHSLLPSSNATLIRPLLAITREEIVEWCTAQEISTRHDATNQDPRHTRNRLRHELLPPIDAFEPSARAHIAALADEARAFAEWQETQIAPAVEAVAWGPDIARVPTAVVRELPNVHWSAFLERVWRRLGAKGSGLTRDHFAHWGQFVGGDSSGHRYQLPAGWALDRSGSFLHVWRGATPRAWVAQREAEGELSVPEWGLSIRAARAETDEETLVVEANARLRARSARAEDRLRIETGHAEVRELLRSAGVPQELRAEFPVIVAEVDPPDEVRWLPGIRSAPPESTTSESTTPETRRMELRVDTAPLRGFLLGELVRHDRHEKRARRS